MIPAGTQNLHVHPPREGDRDSAHERQVAGCSATKITGAQLAALVGGATTPKLKESLDSGLWVTVNVDTVTSFAQQFQP